MRPPEEVRNVVALAASGKSILTISRETGIPRATVRDWLAGRLPKGRAADDVACAQCGAPRHRFDELSPDYAYLLGLYLGDGCISAHPRRVFRLRLFFDARYPEIIDAGEAAIRSVLPTNRINRLTRSGATRTVLPAPTSNSRSTRKLCRACSRSTDQGASTSGGSRSRTGSAGRWRRVRSTCFGG